MARANATPPLDMGTRLTEIMAKTDMSIANLSRIVGVDRRTIADYMDNNVAMNVTVCMKICAALKTTPNYLILGKE